MSTWQLLGLAAKGEKLLLSPCRGFIFNREGCLGSECLPIENVDYYMFVSRLYAVDATAWGFALRNYVNTCF